MNSESTVYGYIKNDAFVSNEINNSNWVNRKVLVELPAAGQAAFLSREIFSTPSLVSSDKVQSSVIHFGCVYQGVEYEWSLWLKQFEKLLQKMYWSSVVVHLQTEISGLHTFIWDSGDAAHFPGNDPLNVRCEWQREVNFAISGL